MVKIHIVGINDSLNKGWYGILQSTKNSLKIELDDVQFTLESLIPEIDSKVWIFFSDAHQGIYKKPFYIADGSLDSFNPFSLFKDNVKSELESASAYPNTKYYYFKNGICIGVDSSESNPEVFIYHPKASIFIDKSGKTKISAEDIEIKGGSVALEKSVLGETLQTVLGKLIDEIVKITVPTGVGPSGPPINAPALVAIKTADIPTVLSEHVKNN